MSQVKNDIEAPDLETSIDKLKQTLFQAHANHEAKLDHEGWFGPHGCKFITTHALDFMSVVTSRMSDAILQPAALQPGAAQQKPGQPYRPLSYWALCENRKAPGKLRLNKDAGVLELVYFLMAYMHNVGIDITFDTALHAALWPKTVVHANAVAKLAQKSKAKQDLLEVGVKNAKAWLLQQHGEGVAAAWGAAAACLLAP